MVNIVADVLTVKDGDSRPTLEMSIEDINSAEGQPTSDTQFDGYTATEFENAERVEFHMDYVVDGGNNLRIVDGRQATWDSQSDTVSVDLARSDTGRQGQYYFEWALIYDTGVTNLANADQVNTVPDVGFYGLHVEAPTDRTLNATDGPDRNVGHIWLGEQSDTPTDSEIESGNVALYAKTDGSLYTKPHGGTESLLGGVGTTPGGYRSGGVQTAADSPVAAEASTHYFSNTSSGAIEYDLPASPAVGASVQVAVMDSTNTTTVDGNGNTIEGSSSEALTSQYASATYRYNGAEWQVV